MNGVLFASDAKNVARVARVPETGRMANVGLRGDQSLEGDVARRRRFGEEFMWLVVRSERRADPGRVLFVVLEEGIVEGDGVIGVVQRHSAVDNGVGADRLFGGSGELGYTHSF